MRYVLECSATYNIGVSYSFMINEKYCHENNHELLSFQDLERGVLENSVIEFKRRGSNYECTTVESVRDICDRVSLELLIEHKQQPKM